MKQIILSLLCAVAACAAAQDIYRWVDERGVIHYGEKPPANRPSTVVNTRPAAGSVDTQGRPIEIVREPAAPQSVAQPQQVFVPMQQPVVQEPSARGMDFTTFTRLQRGMSEGEVLLRAGKPDYESVENFRHFIVKSLYYYPTLGNPYITIVTLRGGRIAEIERTRKTF
jgi:hypothetical protein